MYNSTLLPFVGILSLLTGCGGSSAPEPVTNPVTVAPTYTVTTSGTITGFGSVIVNGVHYNTNGSVIKSTDNQSGSEQDLAVGMVVQLSGTLNADDKNGTAATISYGPKIEGALTFIDLSNKQLTVLGQVVQIDELTVFEGTTFATLQLGDTLEIDGQRLQSGVFYASRIERSDSQTTNYRLSGSISQLNSAAQTFAIGELNVHYSGAQFENVSILELANGQLVRVKANRFDEATQSVFATEVELQKSANISTERLWLEGIVSNYLTDQSLTLGEQTFVLTSNTQYEYGQKTLLANGVRVKVKATRVNGQWQAEKISFINAVVTKLSGLVSAIDLSKDSFAIGTVSFLVTPATLFKDDSSRAVRYFDLKSLVLNDHVEVVAYKNADGLLVAQKVERENEQNDASEHEFKGTPSAITADGFTLLGQVFVTDANTRFKNNDAVMTKTEFFAKLTTESVLEIHAVNVNNQLLATEIEFASIKSTIGEKSGQRIEFKGALTAKSALQLEVNGYTVMLDSNTKLELGDTKNLSAQEFIDRLNVGETLKVEGLVQADNRILALEIEAKRDGD